jgi:hypothetical protein
MLIAYWLRTYLQKDKTINDSWAVGILLRQETSKKINQKLKIFLFSIYKNYQKEQSQRC